MKVQFYTDNLHSILIIRLIIGMLATFMAFLDKDSEIICFEPFFDQYAPNIQMCGAKMVCCPLRQQHSENLRVSSSAWRLDFRELESMISQKTRMIVLNTPHNPTGKVFDREELLQLSEIAIRHNLLVLSDEVYDRLVYPPSSHIRIATLPGMWERTITVGSAGKSFCCTGWRVGWLIGPSELVKYSLLAHSRIVFCANTPLQVSLRVNDIYCMTMNQRKLLVQVWRALNVTSSFGVRQKSINANATFWSMYL